MSAFFADLGRFPTNLRHFYALSWCWFSRSKKCTFVNIYAFLHVCSFSSFSTSSSSTSYFYYYYYYYCSCCFQVLTVPSSIPGIAHLLQIQSRMTLYAPCSCLKKLSMNREELSTFSELDSWVLLWFFSSRNTLGWFRNGWHIVPQLTLSLVLALTTFCLRKYFMIGRGKHLLYFCTTPKTSVNTPKISTDPKELAPIYRHDMQFHVSVLFLGS